MNPLMENLFYLLDNPQTENKPHAYTAAKEVIRDAEQRLTYEEFDRLWNAFFDIERTEDLNCFILGFRLGVQLTLEGLRPI